MTKIVKIHPSKQPNRPHFIEAWAEKRHLKQSALAKELGADKGLVSRWYNGATPGIEWQEQLAALFHIERESLFRHPNDDWLMRVFSKKKELKELLEARSETELDRIQQMLKAAFPQKNGTDG